MGLDIYIREIKDREKPLIESFMYDAIFIQENRSYGFIDASTPELAMSITHLYRNQGIGKSLLSGMLKHIQSKGYKQISLSVDTDNFAYEMYKKFGFGDIHLVGKSMTMLKKL